MAVSGKYNTSIKIIDAIQHESCFPSILDTQYGLLSSTDS